MYRILLVLSFIVISALSAVGQQFNVDLISNYNDTNVFKLHHDIRFNDIWGYEQNGNEYAFMGTTEGVMVIDITDPVTPVQLFHKRGLDSSGIHRDYHTYQNYLYAVSDEDEHGLYVYNLEFLPDSMPLIFEDTIMFKLAHNIFIDTVGAKLYACGTRNHAMQVLNIFEPDSPSVMYEFDEQDYVHDMYAENNIAYLNCGTDGLYIYDFNNVTQPQLLGSLDAYEDQGYNHSGWRSQTTDTYVLADETHGMKLKIIDDSDRSDLQVLALVGSERTSVSIPHNVMIKGDFVYTSYYYEGLYMWNISDPAQPFLAGHYDTFQGPNDDGYEGAWGIYCLLPSGNVLISDMQTGLYILNTKGAEQVTAGIEEACDEPFRQIQAGANIRFENGCEDFQTAVLFDMNGKVIKVNNQLSFESLSPGVYLFNLYGKTVRSGKFVVAN